MDPGRPHGKAPALGQEDGHYEHAQQPVNEEDAAPAEGGRDAAAHRHAQTLPQERDAHEGADGPLPLLHGYNITDERERDRHGGGGEDAGDCADGYEPRQRGHEAADRCDDAEDREGEHHGAELAEAVGERPEDQLEEPEGQHVGGDQDAGARDWLIQGARDRGQQGRDHPVVGHHHQARQAEHEYQRGPGLLVLLRAHRAAS